MNINDILNDRSMKAASKRDRIASALNTGDITVEDILIASIADERMVSLILESMEAVTRSNPDRATAKWLDYAQDHLDSSSNSVKREASRIIGNVAHLFPTQLNEAINLLLLNSGDDGTVVRWGSAYALSRIILIPHYAKSNLYDELVSIARQEQQNGVKSQYLKGIKRAEKLRR